MQITNRVHLLRIDFNVTPQIRRFVNIYLLEGKRCALIDAGVAGTENIVREYLQDIGRDMSDIEALFLTHAHPDHVGGANAIKKLSGCHVYASVQEQSWIEDANLQFASRPIPNFHALLQEGVHVDGIIKEGDRVELPDMTISVLETPGHSQGSLSFFLQEDNALFTGDAIPAHVGIPIYTNVRDSLHSLDKLLAWPDAQWYFSAWESPLRSWEGLENIRQSMDRIKKIQQEATSLRQANPTISEEEQAKLLCQHLGMERFLDNPLVMTTLKAHLREV